MTPLIARHPIRYIIGSDVSFYDFSSKIFTTKRNYDEDFRVGITIDIIIKAMCDFKVGGVYHS